jgi:hypothetical protein
VGDSKQTALLAWRKRKTFRSLVLTRAKSTGYVITDKCIHGTPSPAVKKVKIPKWGFFSLTCNFCFFVFSILYASFTKFLKLNLFSDEFLIFAGIIVSIFANTAF